MPRPSIKQQRRDEILDAFERCIVRYGLSGATLQKVADESGLARPLLRHNVGNREALLEAMLARLNTQYEEESRTLKRHLPPSDRCQAMLKLLFDHRYGANRHDGLLYQALVYGAEESQLLKRSLNHWYDRLLADIEVELRGERSLASEAVIRAVATGILALYFHAESMGSVTADRKALFQDAELAAQRLLETL